MHVVADCLGGSTTSGTYALSVSVDRNTFAQVNTLTSSGLLVTPFTTPTATIAGSEFEEETSRTKFIGRGNSIRVKATNSVYNTNPAFLELTMHARPYQGRVG